MTFFATTDEDDLLAPPETFLPSTYGGGAYARNAARTAVARSKNSRKITEEFPFE